MHATHGFLQINSGPGASWQVNPTLPLLLFILPLFWSFFRIIVPRDHTKAKKRPALRNPGQRRGQASREGGSRLAVSGSCLVTVAAALPRGLLPPALSIRRCQGFRVRAASARAEPRGCPTVSAVMAAPRQPEWVSSLPSSWSYGVTRDGRLFFIK